jgi:DNA-binding CsgD family transcriptional regulator
LATILEDMMTHFDIFGEAQVPFNSFEESVLYLNLAKSKYRVSNLSYWYLGPNEEQADRSTWLSTYDRRYMALYMRDFKPSGDPVFGIGFERQMPLDWAEFRELNETTESIHDLAAQHGVAKQGISFPIKDVGTGHAMFSVNFECGDDDWQEARGELVNTFHLFAHYFHLRVKDLMNLTRTAERVHLSPREIDVLHWAAEGKTAWETAKLLGLSHSAARLYMSNAMMKLKATSKTQAVAVAFRNRIIN